MKRGAVMKYDSWTIDELIEERRQKKSKPYGT